MTTILAASLSETADSANVRVGMVVRIGFLGAGLIAHAHAAGLQGSPVPFSIDAVYDPDTERAQRFAERYGAGGLGAVVDSAAAVIGAVDAVYVCTWTSEHAALVEQAAGAGRAVFCEKPLATNLADATAMTRAVQPPPRWPTRSDWCCATPPRSSLLRRLVTSRKLGRWSVWSSATTSTSRHKACTDPPGGAT